jgi:Tol biopolymer transport system component
MFRIVLTALVSLLAFAGADAPGAATPPPTNGRIAFSVQTGIASMNPDGSGQWGVELQVGDTQPAWSPDGTKLAVVTHWAGRAGIELLQPNGDALGMLTTDGGDAFPAWSPDGKTVAFTNGPNVFLINADGTNRRKLTADDAYGYAARPTWSPDGSTIAYSSFRGADGNHIYAVAVATGKENALTSGATYDIDPSWSPDGRTILFASTRAGNEGIFAMSPDGSGVKLLTGPNVYADYPAWSPDGTQIAFVGDGIWVMSSDGGNAHRLTDNPDGAVFPAWQPVASAPGCTLAGTSANDLLVGTSGDDVMCGLGGDDTVMGLGGNDRLYGGDGNDHLAGGVGRDFFDGGAGNDTIDARNGAMDIVLGGSGHDTAIVSAAHGSFLSGIERPRVDGDLAAWMPVTSDAFEPTNPSQLAFDGLIQDWWNSGSYPPHWVEVDLQYPHAIGRVQLISPQLGGEATVLLLGRSADDRPFRLLHTFKGPFADLQEVDFAPKQAWRDVRYLRLEVGSANAWVSWREIEVYAPAKKAKKP